MHQRSIHLALRCVTAASALACAMAAQSAIVTTGSIGVGPVPSPIGPGDTLLPSTAVWIGSPGVGSLTADAGSFLQLARLSFGSGGTGNGTGLISGAGTRVELLGNGASNSQVQRLVVGDFGAGQLTVNAGAVLDTRGNQTPCLVSFHYCDNFVGGGAGDNAALTISGAGTQVNLGQNLFIAQPGLAIQHLDGYTYGVPGGTTRGTVNVTAGALLSTDRAQVGPRHWSTNATAFERNFAEVNVSGPGSHWVVTGGQTVLNHAAGLVGEAGASILTANDSNAWATLNVTSGGVIEIRGTNDVVNFINLTNGGTGRSGLAGGRTDMLISGAGSQLLYSSEAGILQVGRSRGTANLLVTDGGSVDGVWYLSVGRDGATGTLSIDGASAWMRLNSRASAIANQPSGQSANAAMDIGRSGTGTVNVLNGGQLVLEASAYLQGGNSLQLGRDVASSGTLNISGTGSTARLTGISGVTGGGPAETRNPFVSVGRDGNGTLNISGGGKLLLEGGAVSTSADRRSTSLYIGGFNDQLVGGKGVATVSGVGSEIRLTGSDTFMGVGVGPQSSGQLTVSNQGLVSAIGMNVGRSGGIGVLKVDGASLSFSGQMTSGILAGGHLVIGSGGGTGVATLSNASVVTLSNPGSSGAGLSLGGSSVYAGGDGSMTLSGGSRVDVVAAPGLGGVTVGREGSGFLRLRDASQLNIAGGLLQVGRFSGSDGTLIASEASSITADWVGVGRQKVGSGDIDGGTATLVLINSSLTAQDIVIGSNGFLGGTGNITGNVTNFGTFAPGNSPGTMEISGAFSAEAGSRLILEVQADGQGGFATDRVIFGGGQALDLAHLKVEFRFLGGTNPNDFQAQQLFDIDTFFQLRTAGGGTANLAAAAFAGATFSAQADAYTVSNFSFTVADGASFSATPVPEPASLAMLLAGLALLGGWAQRARPARARGCALERLRG